MSLTNKILRYSIYPLSILYGAGVFFRNKLFDAGILKSKSYDVPVICVGNITVGGTGKTPHSEYIIRLLSSKYRVAVLSRGYKRKSKGFVLADSASTPETIGDEPYQIHKKFADITVAVDADRRNGIENLMALPSPPEVIILDDAFQHRYVKPGYNILLTDYYRPLYKDHLMPTGRLREPASGKKRADCIIVSKCPSDISEPEMQEIKDRLNAEDNQDVYFTTLGYGTPVNIFTGESKEFAKDTEILLVTGIAYPKPLEEYIATKWKLKESIHYNDHHEFSERDSAEIKEYYSKISNKEKAVFVTEKDAVKLRNLRDLDSLRDKIYYIPLEIVFLQNKGNKFNSNTSDYVAENQRNC